MEMPNMFFTEPQQSFLKNPIMDIGDLNSITLRHLKYKNK